MVPPDDLEVSLRRSLPAELYPAIPALARLLADASTGTLRPEDARTRLDADANLARSLRALAGQQVAAGSSIISFGAGAQVGDVQISDVAGRDLYKIAVHLPPQFAPLTAQERRNRQAMIRKVRAIWIDGLLRHSLAEVVRLELAFQEHAEAVALPLNAQYQELRSPPRDLPPGTNIADVFSGSGGGLLILGAPGAGKTTLLLELCRDLLDRAERDETLPIPVVFNLSSWSLKREALANWLLDELNTKYDVPAKVARTWLAQEVVLPLLDGLDEVASGQREACVEAVNAYRGNHLVPLVVCSRIADYEELEARLRLDGAVCIRPLTDAQIDAYVAPDTPRLQQLRAVLATNHDLRALATSPLLLNVMVLAAPSLSGVQQEHATKALWDTYIEELYQRRKRNTGAGRNVVGSLHWVATQMSRLNQSIFVVERLGPPWLPERRRRRAVDAVEGALVGLTVGLGLALVWMLVAVMIQVALGERVLFLLTNPDNPGMEYFVLTGALKALWTLLGVALGTALQSALVLGGVFALIYSGVRTDVTSTLPRVLVGALLVGLAIALWGIMIFPRVAYANVAWALSIIAGMGAATIYAIVERRGRNALVEDLRLAPRRLATGLLFGTCIGALAGLLFAWFVVDRDGPGAFITAPRTVRFILTGVAGGVMLGALLGLAEREVSARAEPNQGIRRSLRSAVSVGGVAWIAVGLLLSSQLRFDGLVPEPGTMTSGLLVWLFQSFPVGLAWGVGGGLAMGLLYGGIACIQHLAARLVLWGSRYTPFRLVPFFEECTERALVYRVGGGYVFIHRLLLEHFAAMTPDDIDRLSSRVGAAMGRSIAPSSL